MTLQEIVLELKERKIELKKQIISEESYKEYAWVTALIQNYETLEAFERHTRVVTG